MPVNPSDTFLDVGSHRMCDSNTSAQKMGEAQNTGKLYFKTVQFMGERSYGFCIELFFEKKEDGCRTVQKFHG
ncbi:MAG: hypothetical protein NPINA01_13130 [Nitrospinaceae bacterium]|nr:MAG: hypothetical protein NPINA01_13130 [Nitrospinaceae bacterium]